MKKIARIFKALSDETRLRIVVLLTQGELCVCDLMAVLQLPQSTISRHLAYLKNAGLVQDRRQGVWMFYRLEREQPALGERLWDALLLEMQRPEQAGSELDLLCRYLAEKDRASCS